MMNKRIFLIDDDPDDAEIFGIALKEVDYSSIFHYLNDAGLAVELLRNKKIPVPDVIFLDINMPLLNGLDCLRELKAIDFLKKIPVVMYSTSYLQKDLDAASALGAMAFWTKPSRYLELIMKLKALMNGLSVSDKSTSFTAVSPVAL
jgi:CheY-like chemotaxis protein